MASLSRRGFLKGAGAAVAVAAFPSPLVARFYKRPQYVHCIGDSIFGRGYARNFFQDERNKEPSDTSLWWFGSPQNMAQLVFWENNLNMVWNPYPLLGRISQAGLPDTIAALRVSDLWQRDDYIMLEDAGDHPQVPNTHNSALQNVIDAITPAIPAANIRTCTTPEYEDLPGSLANELKWDVSFLGQGTMNQATQGGSAARSVTCVDVNTDMDAYRSNMGNNFGAEVWLSDGIHPNIWGQMYWLGRMLNSFGIASQIASRGSLEAIASANFTALRYGGLMTQQQAIDNCSAILGA